MNTFLHIGVSPFSFCVRPRLRHAYNRVTKEDRACKQRLVTVTTPHRHYVFCLFSKQCIGDIPLYYM